MSRKKENIESRDPRLKEDGEEIVEGQTRETEGRTREGRGRMQRKAAQWTT